MKNTLSIGRKINLALVLLITVLLPANVPAQVLNQKVNSLLSNQCDGIGIPNLDGSNPDTSGLGPHLANICEDQATDGPSAQFGNSTGGGLPLFTALRYPFLIRHCRNGWKN